MDLAERLADYTATLNYGDLDEETLHVAKQRIVDSLCCALGAVNSEPVEAIRSYASTLAAGPPRIFSAR